MKRQQSHQQHKFSEVPRANIERSSFDRSHGYKTTFDAEKLIPIYLDEALPGDTMNLSMSGLARLATPIFPILDNLHLTSFFFAVPYRLVWDNWEKFNGEQANPTDSTDFVIPTMTSTPVSGYPNETIHDYMGIPTGVPGLEHSALWHRAYNLIWNEWFRDQNLQLSVLTNTDDGPDLPVDYQLLPRGKRMDYFTSCLPFPQKGDAVSIPLGTSAPVVLSGDGVPIFVNDSDAGDIFGSLDADGATTGVNWPTISGTPGKGKWSTTSLETDLTNATAATINTLRQAFQVQRLLERDARGGTRYVELLKAHFKVTSPDFRLQRPEYLGGSQTNVNIQPVAQTQASDPTTVTPQANLAAIGTAALSGHGFIKSFTEHCLIIGLISVRSDITYQQGLNRMFSRKTRFDFYWPALSHIGEQAVLNKEIFAQGSDDLVADEAVFGYQERYSEYRYKPSQITGKFRSNDAVTLDSWHLAQDFPFLPLLDNAFIVDSPPIDRIIAVPTEPHFLLDCYFKLRHARPMPVFGTPGMIDHF